MELILWRHAEAEAGIPDSERALTAKGHRHAARVGAWLARVMPQDCRVLVSPALRCIQTAQALGRRFEICDALALESSAGSILEAAAWPTHRQPVMVVGHQPLLGQVASLALCGQALDWRIRKGSVFWLADKNGEPYVRTVAGPDLIGKLR